MTDQGAKNASSQVWVWAPARESSETFEHPSDLPGDELTAKARWEQNKRGPRLARISPATLLKMQGNIALIAEQGATREVPKSMVLPWYEGLLLLDELEQTCEKTGALQAEWRNDELRQVLEQERTKFKNISGALYAERRLINLSVTGKNFIDQANMKWQYRRENVKGDDKAGLVDGEDAHGYFKLKKVEDYLPPWQAFCHEKCGFYQDFYLVRWEYPFSEVDYSKVENGCPTTVGATWEPDECLPAHLDPLRILCKRNWIKRQREVEQKRVAVKRPGPSPPAGPDGAKRLRSDGSVGTPEGLTPQTDGLTPSAVATPSNVVKTKYRRDGKLLERDEFHLSIGHDFLPEVEANLAGIRSGWPKAPQDYPPGYRVANPPGFCWEGCDCMDDQRPQRSWETHKAWLEEKGRTQNALAAIELFSRQTHFVRRRGQVSKMCFFETATDQLGDQTHAKAALDLAGSIGRRIGEVLKVVPIHSIIAGHPGPVVAVQALAFLSEEHDAEPLRYEGSLMGGGALPAWLQLDEETGALQATHHNLIQNLHLQVELFHSEGAVGKAECIITPQRPTGSKPPWIVATGNIIARFNNVDVCPIERGARAVLGERLSEIYDFNQRVPVEVSLGQWLKTTGLILRMLRSTAVAHITPFQLGSTSR